MRVTLPLYIAFATNATYHVYFTSINILLPQSHGKYVPVVVDPRIHDNALRVFFFNEVKAMI